MCITIEHVPAHYNDHAAYNIPAAWVARVWYGERVSFQARSVRRAEVLRLAREQYPDAKEV